MGCGESSTKGSKKFIQKIIFELISVNDEEFPDITSLVLSTISKFDLIRKNLQRETINGIYQFLQELENLNYAQKELFKHFQIFYENCIQRLSHFDTLLGEYILQATMEVLICFKSLKKAQLLPEDIWWVSDHFSSRYIQLQLLYKVEYPPLFEDSDYLIQFLYLLQQCTKKEMNRVSALSIVKQLNEDAHTRSLQATQVSKQYIHSD